jgi:uncharacterized membrane protein
MQARHDLSVAGMHQYIFLNYSKEHTTMKHRNVAITTAIGSLLAVGPLAAAAADKAPVEKCFGIVKAGKNDCQTAASACAGTATRDGQKDAWIYVPKGTCDKIVGASLKSGK